ncbi:LuxR C-terminal-related transcriptional regulator [Aurantiacibacter spongiae]|uniref:DNA-binding response regulator n=1 Tax=Aurantiacibacter spongiae TaxID=2488860 RepID=A0A3N5CRD6_9SPHN|nr:response regulator transcription factor [Aurantiacibacter spongiae]RPF71177.1 DNA-binding response regulator [Aurantiacibacter spongiae]
MRVAGAQRSMAAPTMREASVLLVDPHPVTRHAILAALEATQGLSLSSCGASLDAHDVLDPPDIVVLRLPDRNANGSQTSELARARELFPDAVHVAIVDFGEQHDIVGTLLNAGAGAIFDDRSALSELGAVLRLAAAGYAVLPADTFDAIMAMLASDGSENAANGDVRSGFGELTARQCEVLDLLVKGHSNKTIAQMLSISESTVKVHVRAIMAESGLRNRTQIAAHYLAAVR